MKIKLQIKAIADLDFFDEDEEDQEVDLRDVVGASGLEAFVHVLEGAVNLMWAKNQTYGDAWRDQGYMGNLARIMSKVSRLKNMLWRDDPNDNTMFGKTKETVDDTLYDLINLGVFMLLNRGQANRWGHEHESD